MVPDTRPIICLTERSRSGDDIWPRKYFWATMLVAFCDQVFGNSTSVCSKATLSPCPMRASRVSHSTPSNGWTPGVVKRRSILRPPSVRMLSLGVISVGGVMLVSSSPAQIAQVLRGR